MRRTVETSQEKASQNSNESTWNSAEHGAHAPLSTGGNWCTYQNTFFASFLRSSSWRFNKIRRRTFLGLQQNIGDCFSLNSSLPMAIHTFIGTNLSPVTIVIFLSRLGGQQSSKKPYHQPQNINSCETLELSLTKCHAPGQGRWCKGLVKG